MLTFDYAGLEQLVAQEKYIEAEQLCLAALRLGQNTHFWKTQLGYIYFCDEQNEAVSDNAPIEIFEALVLEDPQNANAHFWVGYFSLIRLNDSLVARREIQQTLILEPSHPYARLVLAGFENTPPGAKVELLQTVLRAQPNNLGAVVPLAEALTTLARPADVKALLAASLTQAPYIETSYGVMNQYINEVLTRSVWQSAILVEFRARLKSIIN